MKNIRQYFSKEEREHIYVCTYNNINKVGLTLIN